MLTVREEQQLADVVALVRDVLGPAISAGYLFGSAILGGLKPDSDLDVLVVSSRPTSRAEKRRLANGLIAMSRAPGSAGSGSPAGSRRIEVTLVVRSEVVPWPVGRAPRFDFQYGNWLRDEFVAGNVEPWPTENPDLGVLVTMTLLHGRALVGPPAAVLLEPVPPAELSRLMVSDLPSLLADLATDTRNVLLTLVRIWATVATGEIRSKDGAADWALERLPAEHRAVVGVARAGYLGGGDERWDALLPDARAAAAWMEVEISRLAGRRASRR